MTSFVDCLFKSGTNKHCHLTADSEKELEKMARRLRLPIHGKGRQQPHLDLNRHKRELALKYGALETGE